jgi:glutathione S-transferase
MYTLYYVQNATSMASHIALEWSGTPYDIVATNFGDEILKKLSPIGTAGSLERSNNLPPIQQTPAILRYLARTFPDANLAAGGDKQGEIEIDQWLSFLVSDVHHAFHLIFNPARYAVEDNDAVRDAALALCYRNFGILNAHLKDREFMVGDNKSIVDAYLFPMVRWTFVAFPEDARDYPNVYAFHDRMRADLSVEKVLRDEGTW